tara:strand:- start:293 stop:544 length:252 start_codon:yes stop_codon:yes gene_type:complete
MRCLPFLADAMKMRIGGKVRSIMRKANIAPRAVNSWTALMPRRHERRSGTAATPHERRCSADHERREGADQEKRVGNNHLESA